MTEVIVNIGLRINDEAAFLEAARERAHTTGRMQNVANLCDAALVLFADAKAPVGCEVMLSSAEDMPLELAEAHPLVVDAREPVFVGGPTP
jgi:hypothetical protein